MRKKPRKPRKPEKPGNPDTTISAYDHMTVEESWGQVLGRFWRMYKNERKDRVDRLRKFFRVLRAEADAICREADRKERGVPLVPRISLRERLDSARIAGDAEIEHLYQHLCKMTAKKIAEGEWSLSPQGLRLSAYFIEEMVEFHQDWLDVDRRPKQKGGRPRSPAWNFLLTALLRMRAEDKEAGDRLALKRVKPDGYAVTDLSRRWVRAIRRARATRKAAKEVPGNETQMTNRVSWTRMSDLAVPDEIAHTERTQHRRKRDGEPLKPPQGPQELAPPVSHRRRGRRPTR